MRSISWSYKYQTIVYLCETKASFPHATRINKKQFRRVNESISNSAAGKKQQAIQRVCPHRQQQLDLISSTLREILVFSGVCSRLCFTMRYGLRVCAYKSLFTKLEWKQQTWGTGLHVQLCRGKKSLSHKLHTNYLLQSLTVLLSV